MDADNWKDIPGFQGRYQAKANGLIRSVISTPVVLKTMKQRGGYQRVFLYLPYSVKVECFVHRLIAITFLSNPNDLPFVDHKNGLKLDNRVENLEWVSVQENTIRYYALRKQNVVTVDVPLDLADIPF